MSQAHGILGLSSEAILDSLGHGVYVTDVNRSIVYWNQSAADITGWQKSDIVGKGCYDDVLSHVDKDGHTLCGQEYCPLHRAILTDTASDVPIIVFAQARDGSRIPVHVSVSPLHDSAGRVIGGVETFRSLAGEFPDFERARKIQMSALGQAPPPDDRVRISARYVPKDVVGGDCYRFTRLDDDRYGFFLADVSGHGVAGALYTMFLLSLWEDNRQLLRSPCRFAESMNRRLCEFVTGQAFATAVCGLLDLAEGDLTLACAGGPLPILARAGRFTHLGGPGLPWGFDPDATYDPVQIETSPGDCLLLFTDGATEIQTAGQGQLDTAGLVESLRNLGYPGAELDFKALEQELLGRSNRIRFDDDVTMLEMRLR